MAWKCLTSLFQTFSGPFPPPYPGSQAGALRPCKHLAHVTSRINLARQVAKGIIPLAH